MCKCERAVLVCSWEVAGVALGKVRWVEKCAVLAGPRAPPRKGRRGGCRVGKVGKRRVAGGRGGDYRMEKGCMRGGTREEQGLSWVVQGGKKGGGLT